MPIAPIEDTGHYFMSASDLAQIIAIIERGFGLNPPHPKGGSK